MASPQVGRLRFLRPQIIPVEPTSPTTVDLRAPVTNDILTSERWLSSRAKSGALIVILTSYAAYNAAVDVAQLKSTRPGFLQPVVEYSQPQKTPPLHYLGFPQDLPALGRETDRFELEQFDQARKTPLVAILTSYTPYNAAPDLVPKRRPNTDAYPLQDFSQPQAEQPRIVTDAFYKPQLDVVLPNRQAKSIWPPPDYGPGRSVDLIKTLTTYVPYDASSDFLLRERRPKDVFAGDYGPQRSTDLIKILTAYAAYVPGPDIVLRNRQSKETFPLAEHLQARKPGILSPVFYPYVAALDFVLRDLRKKDVDPPFIYLKQQRSLIPTALFNPSGVQVFTIDDGTAYFAIVDNGDGSFALLDLGDMLV